METAILSFLGAGFLGALGSLIYGLRTDIKEMRREMTKGFTLLSEKVAANGERIAVNGERIRANGKRIAENRELITANGKRIAENRELITANGKRIAEIGAQVSALEGRVGQPPRAEAPSRPSTPIEAEASQAIAS